MKFEKTKKNFYGLIRNSEFSWMEQIRGFFYKFIGLRVGKNLRIGQGSIIDVWSKKVPFKFESNIVLGEKNYISGGFFLEKIFIQIQMYL